MNPNIFNIIFISNFLITNGLFSLIICSFFIHLDKKNKYSYNELLLYSLGTGPALTCLFLYYLFMTIPFMPNLIYIVIVAGIYIALLSIAKKDFILLCQNIYSDAYTLKNSFHKNKYYLTPIIIGFLFLLLAFVKVSQHTLYGHDILEYAVTGKVYFENKFIDYNNFLLDIKTGFYRPSLHGPGFPLLFTWENLYCSIFNIQQDILFKSTSAYYGFLIICIQIFWLSKKNKWLALLAPVALLSGLSFYRSLFSFHIETYRIFFLAVSWIFLAHAINKKDTLSFTLLGVYSGLSSFVHSLGFIIAVLTVITLFLFLDGTFLYKVRRTGYVFLIMIAFGGLHYIIDIFWGIGWIL